jgi:hypothetical protein
MTRCPGVMPRKFGSGETLFTAPLITARLPGPWTLTQSMSTVYWRITSPNASSSLTP